jgi:hypothetical protein
MPLFNSQFGWRGIGTTTVVELLVFFAFAFAVFGYVQWSSDGAVAEFRSAAKSSASDTNHSDESSTPAQSLKGRTGCPQGKRPLPTQLMPMP